MKIEEINMLLDELPQFEPPDEKVDHFDYPYDINEDSQPIIKGVLTDHFEPEDYDLNETESLAIEGAVRKRGIEAIAFYKSFRFIKHSPFPGEWGVFYTNRGISHINYLLKLDFPGSNFSENIGLEFLRRHEHFHAKFDVSILGLEVAAKRHFYLPHIMSFRNSKIHNPEEAIANHEAYKLIKSLSQVPDSSKFEVFFFDFMKRQSGAYARFDEQLTILQTELASGILDGHRYKNSSRSKLGKWMGFTPPFTHRKSDVPEHFIREVRYSTITSPAMFIPQVKIITENSKFTKMLYPGHEIHWESTKNKLIACSIRGSLDFKEFPPASPYWSVRVNNNFRAHLNPISIKEGRWEAMEYGDHKKMKHG